MNIEDLTKSQLLLLMVLVNFIVSIATGVLTVSLLDKAPVSVSQTVNRIVDHTIETISTPIQVVTPGKPASQAPSSEQLLTSAVASDAARTVLIFKGSTTTPAIAYGVYLPKSRAVATATVPGGLPKDAVITFSNGSGFAASISKSNGSVTIYGFADTAVLPDAPAAVLPKVSLLKQGQTAIAISKDSEAITSIISKVDGAGIHTDLPHLPVGAGVVDLSGSVIGMGGPIAGVLITADEISALLSGTATP